MYLKQGQELQIRNAVQEIKKLSTLENCSLNDDIKEKIKLYIMWFDIYANQIEDALNGEFDLLERYK